MYSIPLTKLTDWTSAIGYTDNAAHNNIDFLPWFLAQMKAHEQKTGTRLLDYLDIHYYFQADTSANDDAAKALRLRMTRSLWDPSYVDESYVGTSAPQNHQWNPTAINLIPRFHTLIAQNYPGTKLSISEWSSSADSDLTGGLSAADVLGLFGQYGVDAATYWATPDELGPVGLAYWLYRGWVILQVFRTCNDSFIFYNKIWNILRQRNCSGQPRNASPQHARRLRWNTERQTLPCDCKQEPR